MSWFYILNADKTVVSTNNFEEWVSWFEKPSNRSVSKTKIGEFIVSTVFLGIDHGFWKSSSKPVLFETMIYKEKDRSFLDYQKRYSSYEEALNGHKNAIRWLGDFEKKCVYFNAVRIVKFLINTYLVKKETRSKV